MLLNFVDARVYEASLHVHTGSQTSRAGGAALLYRTSDLAPDLVDRQRLLPQAHERLSRRNLLQISGGTSGSCNLVASGGSLLHAISADDCSRAPTGASQTFVACCADVCTSSTSGSFCTCTGYTDAVVTCDGISTLAGCCSLAGGGSRTGTPQPNTPAPALTPQATLPPTPTQPPPTTPPSTPPLTTAAPTPRPTTAAPTITPAPTPLPTTAAPTPPPTAEPTPPPSVPAPTAPTLTASPSPTPKSVAPLSGPGNTFNSASVTTPTQTPLTTPSGPNSSPPSTGSNDLAIKVGLGIASPAFLALVTAATWAYLAYRYRARKAAIIRATIDECTNRNPPTLPNPRQYLPKHVQEMLKVLLKQVLAKWDSWSGCSHKLSFPAKAEMGIWKREFHKKESLVLVEALKAVDSGFCSARTEPGFDGLLDKWKNKETSRSYIVAEICAFVEEEDVDRWKKTRAPRPVNALST
ncbi:hypothetical protein KFL_000560030 [Klebsormidium nitens]|uniref:Uncharacterized protein n=1 Tax=Klebsormidium nitens TaxID=105231 RepID=A0A1Y1HR01_KLENI|nr:hypothetical protein KFL_000560030 [Klebsormidium nitens]|eukprot:GAQ80513.1 hypothetical protein KFL_000560030 [Klebsormidium nitens]